MSALALYQLVALLLLATGFYGLIWRRSLVGMLICIELLLNGAGLSLVAAAQLTPANAGDSADHGPGRCGSDPGAGDRYCCCQKL